jgi:hypothetical protein
MLCLPLLPPVGRTRVSLHPGQENISILNSFVEGGDRRDGSGLAVGYPADLAPWEDRMQASWALRLQAISYFQEHVWWPI